MPPLERAKLELNADVDRDGNIEKAVFEMSGNLELEAVTKIEHVWGSGRGSLVNGITGSTAEKWLNIDGAKNRAGFYLDLGEGERAYNLNFTGWEGTANNTQWGTGDGDPVTDAQNANPQTQMDLLHEFLRIGEYDSRGERAKLEVGEYSPNGRFDDHLHVTPLSFRSNKRAESDNTFDGSLTVIEIEDAGGVLDAAAEVIW